MGKYNTTTIKFPRRTKPQRKTYDIGVIPQMVSAIIGKKKLCKADLEEWEADVDSEHFDRDDNNGDDNEETKPDPEEIYRLKDEPRRNYYGNRTKQSVLEMGQVTAPVANQFRTCSSFEDSLDTSVSTRQNSSSSTPYVLPSKKDYENPVTVDPVGSPSSTTIDQDEQSTSTSPTNQEIQSQVTH
ncbi:hypothetical protein Tco_0632794 [Tanacetum coccineum]